MTDSEQEAASTAEGRTEQEPTLQRETVEDLEPQDDQAGELRAGRPVEHGCNFYPDPQPRRHQG
jgi:hypothetical protein